MNLEKEQTFRHKLFHDTNFDIIGLVTLIAVMGVASLTPAFPKIAKVLNINAHQIGWLITSFTLPGVLLTPVFGVLADRLGRKKILIPALFLFGIAGTACAFTTNYNILLFLRFLQGIGGASLGSINVTIVGDLYKGKERAVVMGYVSSVLSIGTASYPAIGGVLAAFAWYYPFMLPILAIPVALLVIYSLKNPEPKNEQHLKDYLISTWKSIQNRNVLAIFIVSVATFVILYGSYLTYFPLFLDKTFGASTVTIGLMMSGASIATAITSAQMRRLITRFTEKQLIIAAFAFYAVSLGLIAAADNIWFLILPIIFFGIGQGMNLPAVQTLLASLAPIEYRAAFMSLNGMVLRLGQTIGPLMMGVAYSIWGVNGAFYCGVGLAILMIPTIMLLINIKPREAK